MTLPSLSIIIVSWNTRDLLAQCLRSVQVNLASVTPREAEILVVDNASVDGSAQMIQEHFPWVHLIQNQENVGFAKANNQALRVSSGQYVVLLNPDTEAHPDALISLVSFMEDYPGAGAAGSRLLNPDGTLQPSCSPAPTLRRETWRLFHLDALFPYASYRMQDWLLDRARQVDVVQGAALIVRRAALDHIGLLDEGYFIYSEEVDLCQRIREAGWYIYWVPQSEVVHYGGQSTQQVAAAMFLRLYQGKLLYFRKRHGLRSARIYKLVLVAAAGARLILSPLFLLGSPTARREHLAVASNYWRLLWALPRL